MDSERRQTDNTSGDRNGGWNLKQYVVIALVVFITFCCCILFFFMIYRYNGFADFWKKLTTILQPIIMGLVLAYLLNPVMKFLERHLMKLLEPRMKSKTKAKKMSRGVAIAGAWVFLGGIVVLLIAAIVPSIIQSIQGIATGLPSEVKNIMDWSDEFFKGDSEIVGVINDVLQKASDAVQKFLENDLLAQVRGLSDVDRKRCDLYFKVSAESGGRHHCVHLCAGEPGDVCRTGEENHLRHVQAGTCERDR